MTTKELLTKKNSGVIYETLSEKIANETATIAVIGLGYVGLPLLCEFHKKYNVIGFDLDEQKINSLNQGKSYIKSIANDKIAELSTSTKFVGSTNAEVLIAADIILICVPTPLNKNREPNMSYVIDTTKTVVQYLRKGQCIILESTTYPGTTTELLLPLLTQTDLKLSQEFFLAYSPEREDPGNPQYNTNNIPKVVGADDAQSLAIAKQLYAQIVPEVIAVSSSATAEAVKLLENIFRGTNIALVNELKVIFDKMGINIWEVIEAAKTKPFGYMPFYPGPGLGGHCIPIDPFYLTWKAREYNVSTRFIELAGEINNDMPVYIITRLREELDLRFAKGLNGAKILIMGMAYKKNVDDIRESPGLSIVQQLIDNKALVNYHDPYIKIISTGREYAGLSGKQSVDLSDVANYDAVIICTDHDGVDYHSVVKHSKLIIDTRNVIATVCNEEHDNVVLA